MSSTTNLLLYHLDEGNTYLINHQYQKAIDEYTSCIELCKATTPPSSDQNDDGHDYDSFSKNTTNQNQYITFRAYSHRSESYLQLKEYSKAKLDSKQCHELLLNVKTSSNSSSSSSNDSFDSYEVALTFIRLGQAQFNLEEYDDSLVSFKDAKQRFELLNNSNDDNDYNLKRIQEFLKNIEMIMMKKQCSSSSETTMPSNTTTIDSTVSSSDKPTKSISKSTPTSTLSSTTSSSSSSKKQITCPKYQYYQNDTYMTIAILEPNLSPSKIKVTFSLDKLTVLVQKQNKTFTVICGTLFSTTIVSKSKVKYTDEKILIKLKKKHSHDWHTLFGGGANSDEKEEDGSNEVVIVGELGNSIDDGNEENTSNSTTTVATTTTTSTTTQRPYASHKDWNAIERDLKRDEEADETPGPDGAFNKFLQDIYKGADEETRRAMIKSYQTSGGTHLSCNWNEVAKTDYEKQRTAPKGQEWKNWEGEKLPMKDDD